MAVNGKGSVYAVLVGVEQIVAQHRAVCKPFWHQGLWAVLMFGENSSQIVVWGGQRFNHIYLRWVHHLL